MSSVNVRTPSGETGRSVELPDELFDVAVNVPLIHQVVTAQLAAARQGTHDTKTRGERRGGGAKPYRQKGTGRARQGSIRAPQFAGGGVVHGPIPRSYAHKTPKKMKAAALKGALSDRAGDGRVHVVSQLLEGDTASTKNATSALAGLTEGSYVLVVLQRGDEVTWRSLRNAPWVHLLVPDQLNAYDVLVADDLVFTEDAFADFVEARLGASQAQRPVTSASRAGAAAGASAPAAAEAESKESET